MQLYLFRSLARQDNYWIQVQPRFHILGHVTSIIGASYGISSQNRKRLNLEVARNNLERQTHFHAKPYKHVRRWPTETVCTGYKSADNIYRVP